MTSRSFPLYSSGIWGKRHWTMVPAEAAITPVTQEITGFAEPGATRVPWMQTKIRRLLYIIIHGGIAGLSLGNDCHCPGRTV